MKRKTFDSTPQKDFKDVLFLIGQLELNSELVRKKKEIKEPKFLLHSREALHYMIENPMDVLEIVDSGGRKNRVRFNEENQTFQWFDYHLESFLTLERFGVVLSNTWRVLD